MGGEPKLVVSDLAGPLPFQAWTVAETLRAWLAIEDPAAPGA